MGHPDSVLRNSALFEQRWGERAMCGWLEQFEHLGLVVKVEGRSRRNPHRE